MADHLFLCFLLVLFLDLFGLMFPNDQSVIRASVAAHWPEDQLLSDLCGNKINNANSERSSGCNG